MKSDAPAPLAAEEFIRRAHTLLKQQQWGKGVSFAAIEELFQTQFKCSSLEFVNVMITRGEFVAVKPAPTPEGCKPAGVKRPLLLDSIPLEECGKIFPRLYESKPPYYHDLPLEIQRVVCGRKVKEDIIRKALEGSSIPVAGKENILAFDPSKKKRE
jgi:hypothetical protein